MAVSKEDLFYAAFMARVVYGEEAIPAGYRGPTDDRNDDDYRGYLAREGWHIITDPSSSHFTANGLYDKVASNGLLARKGNTLVLAFRGTDDGWSAVALGEAWTATGMRNHYDNFNELISLAFSYASNPANGINHVLVTGHSLGGSMADMFTVLDGTRFLNIPGVSLSVVSIASAGLDPYALSDYANSIDPNIATFRNGKLIKLKTPSWYQGIYHEEDKVHFPYLIPILSGEYLIKEALNDNVKFDEGIEIIIPNINNEDVPSTFGAEHNMGIYYKNITEIANSELFELFKADEYNIVAGVGYYNFTPDFNGRSAHDNGDNKLEAPYGILNNSVFFLGLDGDDTIDAWRRNDLIDGGAGRDTVIYKGDFEHYAFSYENGILNVKASYDPQSIFYNIFHENDYLVDIEYLQFSDRIISVADLTAGLVGGTPTDGKEVPTDEVDTVAERVPATSSGDVNTITGSREDDYLVGTSNRDAIYGLEGNDILTGYSGQDRFDGGPGWDTVDYSYNPADVSGIVDLAAGTADFTASGFYVESLTSIENVWMGAGNDILIGTDGPNDLRGGPGNDRIIPGGGNDIVYGDWKYSDQGGNDTVVLNQPFRDIHSIFGTPLAMKIEWSTGNHDWFYNIENFEFSDGIEMTAEELFDIPVKSIAPFQIGQMFFDRGYGHDVNISTLEGNGGAGDIVIARTSYPYGDYPDYKRDVVLERLNNTGSSVWSNVIVNETPGWSVTPNVISFPNGNLLVVWVDDREDLSQDILKARAFSAQGIPLSAELNLVGQLEEPNLSEQAVSPLDNDNFVVVWDSWSDDQYKIHAGIWNMNGDVIVPEITVNSYTNDFRWHAAVTTLNSGNFVVVWTDYSGTLGDGDGSAIHGKIFSPDGASSQEFLVNTTISGDQFLPRIAPLQNGGFVVTWVERFYHQDNQQFSDAIRAQIFNANGVPVGEEILVAYKDGNFGFEYSIVIGNLDGGFIIVWENEYELFGQKYDFLGNPVGSKFIIDNNENASDLYANGSALGEDEFAILVVKFNYNQGMMNASLVGNVYNINNNQMMIGDNSPPIASDGDFYIFEGDKMLNMNIYTDFPAGTVYDPENSLLTVTAVNGQAVSNGQQVLLPSGALLTVNVDGRFTYNPNGAFDYLDEGETATDSFTYTIADAQGASDTATVTITIEGEINPVDITGDDTDQTYTGTPKDDHINGLGGNDFITGGAGYDWLQGGDGQDQIYGGDGNDWLEGGPGHDTLDGGAGQDVLVAGDGDDNVIAGAGDDRLIAGSGGGDDSYDGGAGVDTIVFSSTHQGVSVDLLAGTASGAEIGSDTLFRIENVIGGDGADAIRGNAASNLIRGGGLGDVIFGGRGADELHGDGGMDELHGGLGNDTLYGGDQPDTLWGDANNDSLFGGNGNDILYGGAQADLLRGGNDRDILWGGNGNDTLYGEAQADTLHGGNDDDLLLGGAGNDTLYGEAQNDTLHGGMNDDVLWGGNGDDVLYGGAQNDILHGGNEDDALWGGDGNDLLYGEARNDVLHGGRGIDVLWGGGGLDMLHGGAQDDVLHGGFENDQLWGDEGNDTLYGEAQNDILHGGMNDDLLWGGGGNDTLYGDEQNDWLYGGLNNDFLDGGPGNDVLYGGGQADTFYYGRAYGADEIRDFQNNVDKIDLSAFGFASVTQALRHASVVEANVVFDFGGGHTLTVYNTNLVQIQNDLII